MEGKLFKLNEGYILVDDKSNALGQTFGKFKGKKLSLKNCEAITNGYDLGGLIEEVREEFYQSKLNLLGENTNKVVLVKETAAFSVGFDRGFKKALELLGDKKFSEEDMKRVFYVAIQLGMNQNIAIDKNKPLQDEEVVFNKSIQSLQKNEWDVEIEMEGPLVYPANLPKEGEERPDYRPKLDENKCLILKRK